MFLKNSTNSQFELCTMYLEEDCIQKLLCYFQGLPLHIQIDSFEDSKGMTPVHRGYCQVKIFCDKVRRSLQLSSSEGLQTD